MNKQSSFLLKLDGLLVFMDLKVLLLAYIMINLYRSTMLLGDIAGRKTMRVPDVLSFVWQECGSPYLIWIPIVVVADIFLKRMVKAGIE
jgi:hypothetical protein